MRKTMLLFALSAPLLWAQDADRPTTTVAVTLNDGSVFMSSGSEEDVEIRTAYGTQKIPIGQIRSARRLPSGRFQVSAKGLSASGDLLLRGLVLKTAVGPLRVDGDDLRSIRQTAGPAGIQDEATVALWWFGDAVDTSCTDRVKARPFEFQGYEPDGDSGIARRKPGACGGAPGDEDLDLAEQDFTLDVRFKLPKQNRQNVMILQKGSPTNGVLDYQIYGCPNGVLCVTSAQTGTSLQSPPNSLRRDGWNTVTIVQKQQPLSVTFWLNGKTIATGTFQLSCGTAQNRGLNLGFTPNFGGNFESPESIQFLRLSRVARSAEEVEDLEREGDFRGVPAVSGLGVLLRDGSFIRGEFVGLGGPTFQTRFGPLTLSEKFGGHLRLYRMRLPELEEARVQTKEQMALLATARPADREAAAGRILATGEAALATLREAEAPADPEAGQRIAELIRKLSTSPAGRGPVCDVLNLGGSRLQGWLKADSVTLGTRRGKIQIPVPLIAELHFGPKEARSRPLLSLASGDVLELDPAEGSTVSIDSGFGPLSVPFEDVRGLAFDEKGKTWALSTLRASVAGTLSGTVEVRTPLGTLTVPLSEARDLKPSRGGTWADSSAEDR